MSKHTLGHAIILAAALQLLPAWAQPSKLATAAVVSSVSTAQRSAYEGKVEAVRQSTIAAQVAGAVVALQVQAGDRVQANQVLLRIDARSATQGSAASDAQVSALRASLSLASKDLERQRLLYQQKFISQAAFERAQGQYQVTAAQLDAQIAQAGAVRTESGFFVVRAPYAGVISAVTIELGEMATPGRALFTLYDPTSLRVSAALPQTRTPTELQAASIKIELPAMPAEQRWLTPSSAQILPVVDSASHTREIRLDLAANSGATPGMFARVWLPAQVQGRQQFFVPSSAVVQRGELRAVYVVNAQGQAQLRQVRLGPEQDGQIEILAGVRAGERVATDPQAATRP